MGGPLSSRWKASHQRKTEVGQCRRVMVRDYASILKQFEQSRMIGFASICHGWYQEGEVWGEIEISLRGQGDAIERWAAYNAASGGTD